MRRGSVSFSLVYAVVSGWVVLVAGCGGGGGGNNAAGPVTATEPAKEIVAQIPPWYDAKRPQAKGTYVGAAGSSHNPFVAIVVQNGKVVVYVCDGKKLGDWFGGNVTGGSFNLKSKLGTHIDGKLSGSRVTGTLTVPGGSPTSYVAKPAVTGKTGLGIGPGLTPDTKRRWISTEYGLRGVDGDGGVKNGVAVTQKVSGGTTTTAAGTTTTPGGSVTPTSCESVITGGCGLSCAQITSEANSLDEEFKTADKKRKAQIKQIVGSFGSQFVENGCTGPAPKIPK